MRTFKIVCIVVMLALVAVFTYQNTAVMQLNFLFWSVSMSACLLMILTVLFSGIIVGLLLSLLNVRRKARKKSIQIKSVQ